MPLLPPPEIGFAAGIGASSSEEAGVGGEDFEVGTEGWEEEEVEAEAEAVEAVEEGEEEEEEEEETGAGGQGDVKYSVGMTSKL